MRKIYTLSAILVIAIAQTTLAQTNTFPSTGATGIGTLTPNPSSLLDISSTTRGILIPRMTLNRRNAILSPATGLLIYQTNSTPGFYYYSGSAWMAVSPKGVTKSLSNLTPTAISQSLIPGTTNSHDIGSPGILWKNAYFSGDALINGIIVGRGGNAIASNTATGVQALYNNTSGGGNMAGGYEALYSNTEGYYNTANGAQALRYNTTGYYNTATGSQALYFSTTGYGNTANGFKSLYKNTEGHDNTANGSQALSSNTTGIVNTATGSFALALNTNGTANTASGYQALYSNTEGIDNTASGAEALRYNTTGNANTANGYQALYYCTTGGSNTANGYKSLYYNNEGNDNTANGSLALYSNTTGVYNTATGTSALVTNTEGNYNTANGYEALYSNYTGTYNTAIGTYALLTNNTGSNNTAVGRDADVSKGNLTNATALGYNATVNASNKVVIGANTAGMVIGGYANWSNFSDGRFKENVKEDVPGLEFITKLRPVTYTINTQKLEEHIMQNMPDSVKAKRMQKPADYARAKTKIQTGFVAQEVEKTAKEIAYSFDGVNAPQNPTDNYSIAYSQFVVPLVKAVQELSKMNDAKDAALTAQQKINADLQAQIDELKTMIIANNQHTSMNSELPVKQNSSLSQNIPNPFNHTTIINYSLPQQYSSAKIILADKTGKVLKEVNLSAKGKGNLQLDASTFSAGVYQYSLYVNGRLIETKQMEHLK